MVRGTKRGTNGVRVVSQHRLSESGEGWGVEAEAKSSGLYIRM